VTADPLLGHLGRHGEDVPYVSLAALDEDALKGAPMTTRLLVESALRTAITTDGDRATGSRRRVGDRAQHRRFVRAPRGAV
jgi:hypothetical protein